MSISLGEVRIFFEKPNIMALLITDVVNCLSFARTKVCLLSFLGLAKSIITETVWVVFINAVIK